MGAVLVRAADISVQVRDINLERQGAILPRDLTLAATVRWNDVGQWKLTLDRDHPMVSVLATPGSGIVVDLRGERMFSGPTTKPGRITDKNAPKGRFTFEGVTDEVLLLDARAWPEPSNDDPATQAVTNDVRAGIAETVMRAYVNANIGPAAPAARRGALAGNLVMAADELRGPAVVKRPRFQGLLELEREIAVYSDLGFRVVQRQISDDPKLQFEVYDLTDRSDLILLDIRSGTLTSEEAQQSPPSITRAIVGGSGEGTDRIIVQRTTPESEAAEDDWGRVIEEFVSYTNSDDLDELEQTGDERLIEGGYTATAVKVVPSDDQTMLYMRDWREGDRISLRVNEQRVTAMVTAAALIADKGRVAVGMAIGDVSGTNARSAIVARVEDTTKRVQKIEQTLELSGIGLTWTTLPGKPSVFPPDLFADPNADRIVFWDDSAGAWAALTATAPLSISGTTLIIANASDTVVGAVELATSAEGITGTDLTRAMTPAAVKAVVDAAIALVAPPGLEAWWPADTAPSGWLIRNGGAVSRSTYAALFAVLNPVVGNFTAATTDICTLTAHGMQTGQMVYVTSTGTIPAGLTQNANRWVIRIDANTFYLATSLANALAGTRIDITSTGSGTHTIRKTHGVGDGSTTFNVPDMKGRSDVGLDTGQSEFAAIGETGGAKTHTLTLAQTPAHSHTISGFGVAMGGPLSNFDPYQLDQGGGAAITTDSQGSGAAHNILGPYGVGLPIIKT